MFEVYADRCTMYNLACLLLISAFTTIFFTAQNVQSLLAAEILCGIPWGIFQTLTITYASEVCPVALRGYLTTYVNFCWGLGQTIGIGVLKSFLDNKTQWSYRIPYALQVRLTRFDEIDFETYTKHDFMSVVDVATGPIHWYLVGSRVTMVGGTSFVATVNANTTEGGSSVKAVLKMLRKVRWHQHSMATNTDLLLCCATALLRLTSLNRETNFDADETIDMMKHTTALEEKMTSEYIHLKRAFLNFGLDNYSTWQNSQTHTDPPTRGL